jgi:hypothetical protein
MKLHSHSLERVGNSSLRINAAWTEKMRRPASVRITFGPLETPSSSEQLVIEGDVKETMDVMNCLAEMAWGMGWRPRGFAGSLAGFAQNYKLPPQE